MLIDEKEVPRYDDKKYRMPEGTSSSKTAKLSIPKERDAREIDLIITAGGIYACLLCRALAVLTREPFDPECHRSLSGPEP